MKTLLSLTVAVLFSVISIAQTVVLNRASILMPEDYDITGTAYLEELSNGTLQLRLSDDFATPPGPDVRILFNTSVSSGGVEIVNLSDIGHFSGGLVVDVPSSVAIGDYDFIVFFCVAFNQLWASGEFGIIQNPTTPSCAVSSVQNPNGSNTVDICPSDNNNDILNFENSLGLSAGPNYVYLITDENEILQEVVNGDSYNFEGSSNMTQRVYGLNYEGTLDIELGDDRFQTTASVCATHSDNNTFITITKNGCISCENSDVNNAFGSDELNICPSDNVNDIVEFSNSLGINNGDEYAYLVTDEDEILQEIIFTNIYNFEGSGDDEQRVYGLHYAGVLDVAIGFHRSLTTASDCSQHSSSDDFVSILKEDCIPPFLCENSQTFTEGGISAIDICPTDGLDDIVNFENSLGLDAGVNYAYIITDVNQVTQQVISANAFNFEGSYSEEQRVYGMHFDGVLNVAIGQFRLQTTASGCFEHSDNSTFLSITKGACPPVFECLSSTVNSSGSTMIELCASDDEDDLITFQNNIGATAGDHYAYLITDLNDVLISVVDGDTYNFEVSAEQQLRVHGLHYDGILVPQIGMDRLQTTASECFTHSSSTGFVSVVTEACDIPFECMSSSTSGVNGMTTIEICAEDNSEDVIAFQNELNVPGGDNYAYIITDADENLQMLVTGAASFDFEGSGNEEQRVYGMHYEGVLNIVIGQNRMETSASDCFTHSSGDSFLTITKTGCEEPFECMPSVTATTNWESSVEICPNDTEDDFVELRNSLFVLAGKHYAYLITDEFGILQEVTTDTTYNFEGSNLDEQRVYGIHFDGNLNIEIGKDRKETTATGCFEHSGDDLFLTVSKVCAEEFECSESVTATTGWVTEVDICATDGTNDIIILKNNIDQVPGANYAFLLTDEFENLQEVIFDSLYNFESTGEEEQRIYGISYDGELNAQIGENRINTTASECFIHSGGDLFLRINKTTACDITSTDEVKLDKSIIVYPNPSKGAIDIRYENLDRDFEKISLYDINGKLVSDVTGETQLYITDPGLYLLHFYNAEYTVVKKVIIQ
jgi:hypothetical protein